MTITGPAPVQELPEGTVTVLFTDVVGSTELTNRLGDEPAREVLGAADALVREQVERHRGREVKGTGDGLMIAFTSARRAIACAIDIQRAFAEQRRREASRAVDVRIGANTGEVVREEEDLFGATVNAAARIAAEGGPGDIVISEGVKMVLGSATTVNLEKRGEVALRGFDEPWELFTVRWEEAPQDLPSAFGRTPYVGRDEERAELRRYLEQAAQGQGSLIMIGGEPGVGKTRISEELLAEAADNGFLTLTGHCYEMEGAPPYIPFVEIMQAAMKTVSPEALRTALGDEASEVAKVVPELRRLFPDIPPALELPPEQERHYLFNSLRTFTRRASEATPMVLLLDDLHWADDSTLLLVQHYAQELAKMRVLMIGTYRDVELDVGRPLAKALEDLLRKRLAHRIALRRLPLQDVAAMLRAACGQEPPQALVEVVYSETEGNPFFVEEVFQHLREEGKLFDERGRWKQDLVVGELEVPEGVRLVIGRRLQRVDDETRRILTNAAVIGRVFSFDLLEAAGDEDPDRLLDAVDEAEEAHLITAVSQDDREARYMFAHELIRQTLLSGLSLPRRQRLHLRIAEAMERTYADAEARAADLAHHLFQAGAAADVEKTVTYLSLAARNALDTSAFEDALRFYDEAVHLRPGSSDVQQADLLYHRGVARRSLGHWEAASEDWAEALSIFEALGETDAIGNTCVGLASQYIWSARWTDALEIAQRGLEIVPESSRSLRGMLLAMSGIVRSLSDDYLQADKELEQALAVARELDDKLLYGLSLGFKVMHHQWHMQAEQVVAIADEAIDLQIETGNLWNAADTMWAYQYALSYLLRFDESRRMGERCLELAERIGHYGAAFSARRGLLGADTIAGADLDRSESFWKEDLETSLRLDSPWVSNAYSNLARISLWRGDWDKALEIAREGARLEPPGITAGFDWGMLFLVFAYRGEREDALALLEEKRDMLPRPGAVSLLGRCIALQQVIEGLAVLGEDDRCAQLYPLAKEMIATGLVWSWSFMFAETSGGISATAGGDYSKAESHFERALAQCADIGFDMGLADIHRWYATMLFERRGTGDEARARDLLSAANDTYIKYGMSKFAELTLRLLTRD